MNENTLSRMSNEKNKDGDSTPNANPFAEKIKSHQP